MKIALIGGAGVRTPLLVSGLAASDLPIQRIALFDTNQDRLALIGAIARRRSSVPVEWSATLEAVVEGADIVFLSIRPGGVERRAHDEDICLSLGFVGQETVGPAGFAMATRTIPPAVEYGLAVRYLAPEAWLINFTNPVGIVTQAMRDAGAERVIGICDTPTEHFERIADALSLRVDECRVDYFGLNHLGWVREVYARGEPQLHRLWDDARRLEAVYPTHLFESDFLRDLRLLPTEYLFYYYRPDVAIERTRRAGATRGRTIASLNGALFRDLAMPGADAATIYDRYLTARQSGYMQIESGRAQPVRPHDPSSLSGYDRIALGVVRALHFNAATTIPLSVVNGSTLTDLAPDDIIEVPCVVDASGAKPQPIGSVPTNVRELLTRVKAYERMTVNAALTGSPAGVVAALAANPLVNDAERAAELVAALAL